MILQTLLIFLVVRSFGYSPVTSFVVGISLAQIGEFAFVLLSKAVHLGIISEQLYLLMLGTTALSLLSTPLVYRTTRFILQGCLKIDMQERIPHLNEHIP